MKSVAHDFIHGLTFEDLPGEVVDQAKRCLLDLIGVFVAGRSTRLSKIVYDYAASQLCSSSANKVHLLFDGRTTSRAGAAFAGAFTIDSFDAHDGHRLTKGHAGVALLPALLALFEASESRSGREFLTNLVIGYEIATRAGISLHLSACDYHTSGAWNSIAVAAIASRILKLDAEQTMHALGIAEYHGPRSQMMRCIDHPTMVKDGSGWGALSGMTAADLASAGFTGAPAITIESESPSLWGSLGERWCILEQYFKPWPVCRWAQPAIECLAAAYSDNKIQSADIAEIRIETFTEGVRLGKQPPASTEAAQYAIGFPVAAFAVRGQIGAAELDESGLRDPQILDMLSRIRLIDAPDLSALFPSQRLARVQIILKDGRSLAVGPMPAKGDPEDPLSDAEVLRKYYGLAQALDKARAQAIANEVSSLSNTQASPDALIRLMIGRIG